MFNRFRKAKFPDQQLNELQNDLTAYIDARCQQSLEAAKEGQQLQIHSIVVPVTQQFMPRHVINQGILKNLPTSGGYIPRSVAFVQSGLDWHFLIGVYQHDSADPVKQIMFMDLVTRTNTARNQHEANK